MDSTAHVQPLQPSLRARFVSGARDVIRDTVFRRAIILVVSVLGGAGLVMEHVSQVNAKNLEISQLQSQQEKLNQDIAEKTRAIAEGEKAQTELKRAQDDLRSDFQKRITQLEQQTSADQDQQRRLRDDLDRAHKDYQSLQAEHTTTLATVNTLQQRLNSALDAAAKAEHLVSDLQTELKKSATDAIAAKQQLSTDKNQIEKAQNGEKDAEDKLKRAKSDQDRNAQNDGRMQEQNKKLQNELNAAQRRIHDLEQQVANRKRERLVN